MIKRRPKETKTGRDYPKQIFPGVETELLLSPDSYD